MGHQDELRADVGRRAASTAERRRSMRSLAVLLSLLIASAAWVAAWAQIDPCAEQGPDCRPLTSVEVTALKARLLALRAALPVPDPARWAPPPDVGEAFTLPFVAEANAGAPMICGAYPAGAFTELNDVHFVYDALQESGEPPAAAQSEQDPLAWVQAMQATVGNRIEVLATLRPFPFLVAEIDGKCVDVSDPEATNIEKSATFLCWESSEGTLLTMAFGARSCREADTERAEKPAKTLAPVMAISLEISGPSRDEVAALKKKIDRRAFEALLGPVAK